MVAEFRVRIPVWTQPSAGTTFYELVSLYVLVPLTSHGEVVKVLVERGVAIDAMTDKQWLALHCAPNGGYVEVVKIVLERGAAIDATSCGSCSCCCSCLTLFRIQGLQQQLLSYDGELRAAYPIVDYRYGHYVEHEYVAYKATGEVSSQGDQAKFPRCGSTK